MLIRLAMLLLLRSLVLKELDFVELGISLLAVALIRLKEHGEVRSDIVLARLHHAILDTVSKESIQFDTPTLTAKAIYRLSDGLSYAKADEEAAGFATETGSKWYEQV